MAADIGFFFFGFGGLLDCAGLVVVVDILVEVECV
jgi:hypothetical protein